MLQRRLSIVLQSSSSNAKASLVNSLPIISARGFSTNPRWTNVDNSASFSQSSVDSKSGSRGKFIKERGDGFFVDEFPSIERESSFIVDRMREQEGSVFDRYTSEMNSEWRGFSKADDSQYQNRCEL